MDKIIIVLDIINGNASKYDHENKGSQTLQLIKKKQLKIRGTFFVRMQ